MAADVRDVPDIRWLALKALQNISRGEKPKEALDRATGPFAEAWLLKKDRAFLMEMVYGVLRKRDTLDGMLKRFLKKPSGLDAQTIDILRLGAYQIFFMRVPEWAAVNETVRLALPGKASLVNAVLRNAARVKSDILSELREMEDAARSESTEKKLRISYIATLTSHPQWLIGRWATRFGLDEAMALAEANNTIPPLTLRVNTLRTSRDDLISKLRALVPDAAPTVHSPDGIMLKGAHSFGELKLAGEAIAQDEAAQLITYLLDPRPGERILDACAAPGGKTTHMAQLMKDEGEITAVEKDEKRIPRLKENIEALGIKSVLVVKGDVKDYKGPRPFERILVDAPCSALGVIRRNPDVKYRHSAKDLAEFGLKQLELLRSASGLLKKAGVLVYATCSTEPEEGEEVIEEFLKSSADFHIIEDVAAFGGFIRKGFFRTYPHRHDMDGFFGVRLRKAR